MILIASLDHQSSVVVTWVVKHAKITRLLNIADGGQSSLNFVESQELYRRPTLSNFAEIRYIDALWVLGGGLVIKPGTGSRNKP